MKFNNKVEQPVLSGLERVGLAAFVIMSLLFTLS